MNVASNVCKVAMAAIREEGPEYLTINEPEAQPILLRRNHAIMTYVGWNAQTLEFTLPQVGILNLQRGEVITLTIKLVAFKKLFINKLMR